MSIAGVMVSPCITAEGPGERGGQETVITALLVSMPSSTKMFGHKGRKQELSHPLCV